MEQNKLSKSEPENNHVNKPTSNYFTKFLVGAVILGSIYDFSYSHTRPELTGEVVGSRINTNKNSELFIKNYETNTIDTLILKTSSKAINFVWGNPETFEGKVNELESILQPGKALTLKLNKKEVYRIENIYDNKEQNTLTQYNK